MDRKILPVILAVTFLTGASVTPQIAHAEVPSASVSAYTDYIIKAVSQTDYSFAMKASNIPQGGKLVTTWYKKGDSSPYRAEHDSAFWWSGIQQNWHNAQGIIYDANGKIIAKTPIMKPLT